MEETTKLKGVVPLLALALGNIAQSLASVGEINGRLVSFFGVRWIGYLFFSVFVVLFLGYFFGFSALYQRIVKTARGPYKILWLALLVLLTAGATFADLHYLPRPKAQAILEGQIKRWTTSIFNTQDKASKGGFRTSISEPNSDPQVFTTAQGLTAVLSLTDLSPNSVTQIRSAFDFIDEARDKSGEAGWGYWRDNKTTVTEIAAWVTVARISSLRSETVWRPEEKPEVVKLILRDLEYLAQRQDSTGGFSPIKEISDQTTRTYSTAMAIWAFIEAFRTPLLRERVDKDYNDSVRNGFKWLNG